MIGRNPLWVAKQHGHSLLTMLRVYAAWTADAPETDAAAIQEAMGYVNRNPERHGTSDLCLPAFGTRFSRGGAELARNLSEI